MNVHHILFSRFVKRLTVGLLLGLLGLPLLAAEATTPATNSLCVMTYNLRFASPNPPNAWPQRRPLMREVIQKVSPDIMGTQEGLHSQLQDLAADLPDYTWVGTGRDGGNAGEFMAVFYRKARLEPLATNQYWLSDTPEVVASSTWGNKNRRMVTTVKFRDLQTKQEFYLCNTHFDHEVQLAREKSAELVRQRVAALNTSLPIILTGDFNALADNKAHAILVRDNFFSDTWMQAKERRGEGLNTFNGFKALLKNNQRIDWILTRGQVSVDATEIVDFNRDGQFPSDHCPLVVWLRLGE